MSVLAVGPPLMPPHGIARGLGRFGRPRPPEKATRFLACSFVPRGGAGATCVRGAGRSAAAFSSLAQSRAGANGEEPMTTTDIILLIHALAAVVSALVEIIGAWREGP